MIENLDAPVTLPQNIDGVNIHLSYIRRDLESINKKIDSLGSAFVTHEEFNVYKTTIEEIFTKLADKKDVENVNQRTTDIESNQKWIVRTIIGFIIVAVLEGITLVVKK